MMTNGPAAGIGEVMAIDFPRPINRDDIMEDPLYYELRNRALVFLYNRFAHDDTCNDLQPRSPKGLRLPLNQLRRRNRWTVSINT